MTVGTSKLEAVNRLLRIISQAPVSSLDDHITESASALEAIEYAHREVCMMKFPFCTEHKTLEPNANGEVLIGNNVLGVEVLNYCDRERYVVRGSKLYDKQGNEGFKIDKNIEVQLTVLVPWDDLLEHIRQYIMLSAARTWVRDQLQDPVIIQAVNDEWALAKSRFLTVELGNNPVNLLTGSPSGWERGLYGHRVSGRSYPL